MQLPNTSLLLDFILFCKLLLTKWSLMVTLWASRGMDSIHVSLIAITKGAEILRVWRRRFWYLVYIFLSFLRILFILVTNSVQLIYSCRTLQLIYRKCNAKKPNLSMIANILSYRSCARCHLLMLSWASPEWTGIYWWEEI